VPVENIWHERAFVTSGSPVGLSPLAYGVLALGGYLSAQQFAADWFSGSAIPAAALKNSAKVLSADQADAVKARFKESVATGDVFVTGSDWDYSMIGAKASESGFESMLKLSAQDICRFYGVPADLVDVESTSGSITYANVTQRNLQLLTLHLGPALIHRETAFSNGLTPRGQVVKFNADALLRLDPASRITMHAAGIASRITTVSEARALENRPPLTPEDEAEFSRLFPAKTSPPTGVPNNV
jgi:HK97 family phage portal protein